MNSINKQVQIKNWGLIDYPLAFKQQELLQKAIIETKLANSKSIHPSLIPNYLIFCEHPHVYTLGKSGTSAHLLINQTQLTAQKATFFHTNRGGDITYHGPGQLVLYPILDLENFFMDIARYLRLLEEAVIATLQDFDLPSGRIKGLTGVWIAPEQIQNARKICAIGIRISRWVTMHGLALNVYPDLSYFEHIVPCGISASQVTSIAHELGWKPSIQTVLERLQIHMTRLFDMRVEYEF